MHMPEMRWRTVYQVFAPQYNKRAGCAEVRSAAISGADQDAHEHLSAIRHVALRSGEFAKSLDHGQFGFAAKKKMTDADLLNPSRLRTESRADLVLSFFDALQLDVVRESFRRRPGLPIGLKL